MNRRLERSALVLGIVGMLTQAAAAWSAPVRDIVPDMDPSATEQLRLMIESCGDERTPLRTFVEVRLQRDGRHLGTRTGFSDYRGRIDFMLTGLVPGDSAHVIVRRPVGGTMDEGHFFRYRGPVVGAPGEGEPDNPPGAWEISKTIAATCQDEQRFAPFEIQHCRVEPVDYLPIEN